MRKLGCCSVLAAVLLVACGAGDATTSDSPSPPGLGDDDRSAAEAEVARLQQQLGEATCASTAADVTLIGYGSPLSPDATYDHPTCRDAFVVDAPGVPAGSRVQATTYIVAPPGTLDPIGCFFDVGFVYLYEKRGATYTLINQAGAFGLVSANRLGAICGNVMTLPVPRAGDYKVVASSVRLFTTVKNRVGVSVVP
jgi:hypothetical protein